MCFAPDKTNNPLHFQNQRYIGILCPKERERERAREKEKDKKKERLRERERKKKARAILSKPHWPEGKIREILKRAAYVVTVTIPRDSYCNNP